MPDSWRDRRVLTSAGKELGCGLLTMLAFTAPLWAFSMATRGPRFAVTMLVLAMVVMAALVFVTRALRKR